jgi:hypothetical protein
MLAIEAIERVKAGLAVHLQYTDIIVSNPHDFHILEQLETQFKERVRELQVGQQEKNRSLSHEERLVASLVQRGFEEERCVY